MDFNVVIQTFQTVGFPIGMCLILMAYIYKMGERHKEEIDKMSDAVENNTIALTKLLATLDTLLKKEK